MFPRIIPAAATVGLVFALAGCPGQDPEAAAGACYLTLDVTAHPGPDWVKRTLDQGFTTLQTSMCAETKVIGGLVTDYSKASLCQEAVVQTNPLVLDPRASTQRAKYERLAKEAWEGKLAKDGSVEKPGVRQELASLMDCGVYGPGADPATANPQKLDGSDVFGAVASAAEAVSPVEGPHTLIFLSDMRNTMEPLKMPYKGTVAEKVERLQADGVPDLAGASVIVVGPGTSDELTPAEQTQLVDFWKAYFAAAKAGEVRFQQTIS